MSSAPEHMICGSCGYPVHGLPTFTCPECGSDLRAVGIARRRSPRAAGLRRTIVLLSLAGLGVLMAMVVFGLLAYRGSAVRAQQAQMARVQAATQAAAAAAAAAARQLTPTDSSEPR